MPDHKKKIVASKVARYPRIDDGNITSSEIRSIAKVLDTEFEDNTFIQFIIKELETFANKMDIEKDLIEEDVDTLSPKMFVDKSFEEIYNVVSANKDEYFKLIEKQFENATHINGVREKNQTKVLKAPEGQE